MLLAMVVAAVAGDQECPILRDLRAAHSVCHDRHALDPRLVDMLPRRLPKYDQPKYPRQRHLEIVALGILEQADMLSALLCTHPWNLVAKSCNRLSRLVTDASLLTPYEYPRITSSPVLHTFLHELQTMGGRYPHTLQPIPMAHVEWDFCSFFYQIPLGTDLRPLFTLLLTAHGHTVPLQHTVLPQGWRPSSGVAQAVARAFCHVLMHRASAQGVKVHACPWIDNVVARMYHQDIPAVIDLFHQLAEEVGLQHKPPTIDEGFLNVVVDWLTSTFKVNQQWCEKAADRVQSLCNKQTNQLRSVWAVIGRCSYHVYTTTRLLWQLRHAYSFMSQIARTQQDQGEQQINWQQPVQVPDTVRQELLAIRESMLSEAWYPMWHPPSLPDMTQMDVLVVDASIKGYGYHFRSASDPHHVIKASRVWGPEGAPKFPKTTRGVTTMCHDQFTSEVMGLVRSAAEVIEYHPTGRQKTPILIVSDCQAISKCFAKQYTHHCQLMDWIMDMSPHKEDMYVTWWLGDSTMPADPESRAGRHQTRRSELTSQFVDYVQAALTYGRTQGYYTAP